MIIKRSHMGRYVIVLALLLFFMGDRMPLYAQARALTEPALDTVQTRTTEIALFGLG